MGRVLGSQWGSGGSSGRLSPHLLATIYPVDAQGQPEGDVDSVVSPITDATIELTANWQSPFEQSGPESKAPAIMSMLQQGTLESYVTTIFGKGSEGQGLGARISQEVTDFSRSAQGRSGMTKLNSTQVFTGAPPVKISMTLHFRAFRNARTEVEDPVDQLVRWQAARELAPNGSLVSAVRALKDGTGFLKALLPSRAPQMVAFRFGGKLFSPMVIESMSRPLTVPRTSEGQELHTSVQLSLATLTALDSADWRRAAAGLPTLLFNSSR